jgi:hypothetical protein
MSDTSIETSNKNQPQSTETKTTGIIKQTLAIVA